MHSFLIVGTNNEELKAKSEELAKQLKAKVLSFPIVKVEDTRNLNNLIRLSFNEPTLIVCDRINEAGEEALNAFLKNLEEPQENIYFALTSPSVRKVLPTIVSRCQVIKSTNKQISKSTNEDAEKFLNMSIGEKLNCIDKIKDRNKAIELVDNSIIFLHSQLHSESVSKAWPFHNEMVKYKAQADNIEVALKTLTGLKANGNVNLQLTYLVTHLTNG